MNKVVLIGRLTKDPELRTTASDIAVCSFTVAVDRKFKSEGQPTADFINVIAWRQTAEFVSKYFNKGSKIALSGSIQTRSWEDKEGSKRYATEVVADGVEFCERKSDNPQYEGKEAGYNDGTSNAGGGFFALDDDSDIPF